MVQIPFKSPKQQIYLKINEPKIHDKWQKEHGNATGLSAYMKRIKKHQKTKKSEIENINPEPMIDIANALDFKGLYRLADMVDKKLSQIDTIGASCKSCGKPIGKPATCEACGWTDSLLCPECAMKKYGETDMCPECGAPINTTTKEAQSIIEKLNRFPLNNYEEIDLIETNPDYQKPSEEQQARFSNLLQKMHQIPDIYTNIENEPLWRAVSALMGSDTHQNILPSEADELLDFIESKLENTITAKTSKKLKVIAKKLTYKEKQESPCIFPKTHPKVKDNKDHYPIPDLSHAQNALARSNQDVGDWYNGTANELRNAVKRAVYKKFPGLKNRKEKREASLYERVMNTIYK